jgi:hypothetical protein
MTDQGLRAALNELIEEMQEDPWVLVADRLTSILAAHPAEPAPAVTDEAVEELSRSLIGPAWATFDEGLRSTLREIHRAALEAAASLLGGGE